MRTTVLTALLILLLSMLSGCQITGKVVHEDTTPPAIMLGDVQVLDTAAHISWTTNEDTTASIQLGENVQSFSGSSFTAAVDKLEPGKTYYYQIRACDRAGNCGTFSSKFVTATTRPASAPAITAAAVADTPALNGLQNTVSFLLYGLVGMVALFVLIRTGSSAIAALGNPDEKALKQHVENGKALLDQGHHAEAHERYNLAREAYMKLRNDKRVRHYDGLYSLYESLSQHIESKEAHRLSEKFAQGTITKEELDRLSELLMR